MMDDLFIQQEVVVKTEPVNDPCFEESLTERFLLDVPHNDNDLMAYLNHTNPSDKNCIKKEPFETEDGTNIFETGNHFMDPDAMIAHYEEVVQDISSTVGGPDDILLGVSSEPVRKEPKQRRSGRKKRNKVEGPTGKTRSFLRNIIKTEEDEDNRNRNLNFECSLCMFSTARESELKTHMLEHIGGPDTDTFVDESHNGDGYACFFCDFITPSSELFRNHIKYKHSGSSPSKPTRKKNDRGNRRRSQTESDDDVDVDDGLDSIKVEAPDLSVYMMEPSTADVLPCKLCSINTTSRSELHNHMIQCHSQKLLECAHCDFFTVYKSTLKRHEMRHSQIKMYRCKYCNFSTYNLSTFQNHELSHNELKPYPCDECNFRAKSRDSLRQHKKLHSGDMPFVCTYCSYRASKKSRIIRHERIHTGERPYACPHCHFRCNQGSTLKIHIRRHTGEKPYKCNLCSFRAVSKCSLNAHLRKHNSIKGGEFICRVCEQIYNNKTALLKHEKSHEEEALQGYLKPITNKRRKLDELAESVIASTVPEEVSPSKSSRKRQRNTTKRQRKRTIVSKEPEMEVDDDAEEEDVEVEEDTSSILRLYRCSICPYRCSKFTELSNHMSTHKGSSDDLSSSSLPKKYRCTPCNMFFSRKRELKAHMKEKHEKKERNIDFPMPDYMLDFNDE
ncbi:Zinc finger protein [Armadillidium nasatum]|uniref:Zinc finger protein n=1 Tax=Armadillidium nasatum TaxID=96803 RepID=A0A5N5SLZ0_9CRUS|nr:Zinc finger protein [Armadillidium nasatum]